MTQKEKYCMGRAEYLAEVEGYSLTEAYRIAEKELEEAYRIAEKKWEEDNK